MIEIAITKKDILPLVYFIVSMFQKDDIHRQGTSSKSDYIGGFIDRWINKIPESLLFNKLLLAGTDFTALTDFFVYGPESDKNAPDILGLKHEEKILKFTSFHEKTWKSSEGMPFIEVKAFKKSQYLATVRETQLDDKKYYVFAETDIRPDYLISLFDKEFFETVWADQILMDECFIASNTKNVLCQPKKVDPIYDHAIGSVKLLAVVNGLDFRKTTTKCSPRESIWYVKSIEQTKERNQPLSRLFTEVFAFDEESQTYGKTWNGMKMIPLTCVNPDSITVVKINKGSCYIRTAESGMIYDQKFEPCKTYKIIFNIFERSSGWTEYVGLKNQFAGRCDRTQELKELLIRLGRERLQNNEL